MVLLSIGIDRKEREGIKKMTEIVGEKREKEKVRERGGQGFYYLRGRGSLKEEGNKGKR